jgi:VCBS repeat-containing protein
MMNRRLLSIIASGFFAAIVMLTFIGRARAATFIVPDEYPTIQQAIDAASPGDIVYVRPGTYFENISLYKSVSIEAMTFDSNDPTQNTTIIDGGSSNAAPTIFITTGISPMPSIRGFIVRYGYDGVSIRSEIVLEDNYFVGGDGLVDYKSGGGGILRNNVFYASVGDAIDLYDMRRPLIIEINRIMYSGDDGIEIRLRDTELFEPITITIRNNEIIGCDSDGIHFIDYDQPLDSKLRFVVTGNVIANCGKAGIGLVPYVSTPEYYSGADIVESIHVYNNTFYGNDYGISGGDNQVVFNNIFVNSITRGVWRVKGSPQDDSVVAYSLFFNNGIDAEESELGAGNLFEQDPLFASLPNAGADGLWETVDDDFSGLSLLVGSPAIDVGVTQYIANSGEAIPSTAISSYFGLAPDLGWKEFDPSQLPPPTPTPTPMGLGSVSSRVSSSSDDAEERISSGSVNLSSTDLELGADNDSNQWIGMRFNQINIPQGATILGAYIEFEVDETGSDPTSVTIHGQAVDDAPSFSTVSFDISNRARTLAQVAWNDIPPWTERNVKWQTPDLSTILQEIVDRPFWVSGNSIAILLKGTGRRTAESYNGEPPEAAKIVVEYTTGSVPEPTETPTTSLTPTATPAPTQTPTPTVTLEPPPPGTIRFSVIGDYGADNQPEEDVANLVKSWNPDFIITTGDNNYPEGKAATIDENIGQYYQEFIYPYVGAFGPGASTNRFFPSLGNHDVISLDGQPYFDYFTLPGNERYYEFVWGPVHFFVINSNSGEPDGRLSTSVQGAWLQAQLSASTAPWNVVYMHHPPFSSGGVHGSEEDMQWPYQEWGASVVLAGHDHVYERIIKDGFLYYVNGVGGGSIYGFGEPLPESIFRYNRNYGAMLVEADETNITFEFFNRYGLLIDTYTLGINLNEAPYAGDDSYTTDEDMLLSVTTPGILGNDTDADTDTLTAVLVGDVSHGTLILNGDGSFSYTPDADFNGADSFTYKANDGLADSNIATVTITVNAVNDPPVAEGQPVTTDEDTSVAVTLTASDVDGDGLTFIVVTGPSNGSLSGTTPNLTYTPNADFNGSDSFNFKVNDGTVDSNIATVSLTVNPVNDPAVADYQPVTTDEDTAVAVTLTASDVDGDVLVFSVVTGPSNGSLSGTTPNLTYTPNADFNGADSFSFKVNDGSVDSNIATAILTVNPVNDPPVAVNDLVSTMQDTQVIVSVLANDMDVDGDTLILETVDSSSANGGTISINPDGSTVTFSPAPGFLGEDTFTYTASDGTTLSNLATVNVNVLLTNHLPEANVDSYATDEDTPLNVTAPGVLSNDIDA